jgi:RNA polymerase sigma factor (sigma-70 family)
MDAAALLPFPVHAQRVTYRQLTRAEQIELSDRMRDERLPESERVAARNELLLACLPWVFNRCQRASRNTTTDDEYQEVVLEVLRSLGDFDARKGALSSWTATRAFWVISRDRQRKSTIITRPQKNLSKPKYHERIEQAGRVVGLEAIYTKEHAGSHPLAEAIDHESAEIRLRQFGELRQAMARLPAIQRDVLRRRLAGETLQEVGDRHDLSKERIRQIQKAALKAVRKLLGRPADDTAA